jgi:hypothetical protein
MYTTISEIRRTPYILAHNKMNVEEALLYGPQESECRSNLFI